MALEVQPLKDESIEWDAFVRSMPSGSPFHLLAWKHGIEGVLPLFEVRGLLGGRGLISVPYGVYGGICGRSEPARRRLLDHATGLARRVGAGYVELRHRAGQEMDLPTKSLYVNFSRPISGGDEENLAAIPRKQRRMTRQGLKHGLRAEFGMQHLDAFYDVYARSVHTLGSPVFPRRLFIAISQEFQKECELLTIWKDERVVAGVLTLLYEGQALPYYGGALREAFPYAVNDFMYWELLCHVAHAGYRVFDFGRSREGTGPYNFKRHWGFEPQPLPYQYALLDGGSIPNVSPANPKMRLAVEAWKRAPYQL